jgi:hypothetical protein
VIIAGGFVVDLRMGEDEFYSAWYLAQIDGYQGPLFGCRGSLPREDELPLTDDLAILAPAVMGQAIERPEYDAKPSADMRISLGTKHWTTIRPPPPRHKLGPRRRHKPWPAKL